jgi:AraC family transcriptional regulator
MDLQDNEIPPLREFDDWSSGSTPADTGGVTPAGEIATYESVYPYAPLLVSPPAFWRALRVLHYRHAPADLAFPALPDIEITVHLQGRAHVARSAGGPWERKLVDHGQIGIAPAGQADRWSWDATLEAVNIYLSGAHLQRLAESLGLDPARAQIIDRFAVRDPLIEQIGRALLGELRTRGVGSELFGDAVAETLALHLLRQHSAATPRLPAIKRGLAGHQLRRVAEYVAAHLGEDFGLDELSQIVGLSRYHFSRMFKLATGLTPLQYVAERRLDQARQLLAGDRLSIAEISATLGYSSQSHFTAHFRRGTGVTPGAFRRAG